MVFALSFLCKDNDMLGYTCPYTYTTTPTVHWGFYNSVYGFTYQTNLLSTMYSNTFWYIDFTQSTCFCRGCLWGMRVWYHWTPMVKCMHEALKLGGIYFLTLRLNFLIQVNAITLGLFKDKKWFYPKVKLSTTVLMVLGVPNLD